MGTQDEVSSPLSIIKSYFCLVLNWAQFSSVMQFKCLIKRTLKLVKYHEDYKKGVTSLIQYVLHS